MSTSYDLPPIPYTDEIAAWNAEIDRARREYRLNPFAACGVTDCDRLRRHGRMCSIHAGPNYRGRAGAVDGRYRSPAAAGTMNPDTTVVGPGRVAAQSRGLADRLDTTD